MLNNIYNTLNKFNKLIILLFNDSIICFFSIWLSISIRLENIHFPSSNDYYIYFFSSIIYIPIFFYFGIYKTMLRYIDLFYINLLTKSCLLYSLIFITTFFIFNIKFSISIAIIQPIIFFVIIFASRLVIFSFITSLNKNISSNLKSNILIYGAGDAGSQFFINSKSSDFNVVAFLDDDPDKQESIIANKKIYSPMKIKQIIERDKIDEIIVAIPSIGITQKRSIIKKLNEYNIKVRSLPSINEIFAGTKKINQLSSLKIEELLEKNIKDPIDSEISFKNDSILVTGAGGSIGSELCRQLIKFKPKELIILDMSEFNLYKINSEINSIIQKNKFNTKIIRIITSVSNESRLKNIFIKYSPTIIYHAAAYKHVNIVENNVIDSVINNVFGTLYLVNLSIKFKIKKFVLISTDKAVNPKNVMGATKKLAEMCLQSKIFSSDNVNSTIFSIVRFGNVIGTSGSVVPLFNKQISNLESITVTHKEVTRYFMTVFEAVNLIIQAFSLSKGGEIYVLDMGEPVKILDLAKKMIRLSGLKIKDSDNPDGDIEIKIIGLKPGEKLHEELYVNNDRIPTKNKNIFITKEQFVDNATIELIISKLKNAINNNDVNEIFNIFETNIPGYNNKSS